jgi:predicted MFS family arabinose efflux permease
MALDSTQIGWQVLMTSLSMPIYQLGLVFSFVSVLSLILSLFVKKFLSFKFIKTISILNLMRIVLLASILFIQSPNYVLAVLIYLFMDSTITIRGVLFEYQINKQLKRKTRATVLSIRGAIITLCFSLFSLLNGYILDLFGIQKGVAMGAIFAGIGLMFLFKANSEKNKQIYKSA